MKKIKSNILNLKLLLKIEELSALKAWFKNAVIVKVINAFVQQYCRLQECSCIHCKCKNCNRTTPLFIISTLNS